MLVSVNFANFPMISSVTLPLLCCVPPFVQIIPEKSFEHFILLVITYLRRPCISHCGMTFVSC